MEGEFDALCGAHDVARGKPAPDLFLLAATAPRRGTRALRSCSRTRRSASKARAVPACTPWPSRRASPPRSLAGPHVLATIADYRDVEPRHFVDLARARLRAHRRRLIGPHERTRRTAARQTRTRSSPSAARSSRELRAAGSAYPNDFRRDALAGDLHALHGAKPNETLEPKAIRVAVAGRMMLKRVMGKACFATLQDMSGRIQLYVTLDGVGAEALDVVQALGPGRHRRRDGHAVQDPDRRAVGQVRRGAPAREGAAAAAGEVPRPRRPGAEVPPALRRPDHEPGVARRLRQALADRAGDPRVLRRARLPRGRDADDASDPGRRGRAAVQDAPQRARHAALPAHRAGAVPEAPRRRRPRARVRDQPQLPQRGHLDAAQPRVHDARVLRGVPGLPLPDGPHRGAAARASRSACSARPPSTYQGETDRPRAGRSTASRWPRRSTSTTRSYPLHELAKPEYLRVALAPFDVEVFPTDGARPAAAQALRGDHRGQARAADVHRRAPDRRVAARARATTPTRRSPTASSCSSRGARSPTASPS